MSLHQVVVPMIVVEVAVESGVGRRELYKGATFDGASVTEEHLAHLVDGGFVEEVEVVDLDTAIAASAAAGDAASRGTSPVEDEEPARNASRDEWVAFALTKGATEESVVDLKRDELVEKFGTPPA